ncbi:MAG: restriction endonuclease, partial [Alteraurantiacibacter sp.]
MHDIKLRGDSTVPHQIDVSIQRGANAKRMIIECKDFDLRDGKVGLDIVRSFRSVLEDTDADEAVILTCVGYTREARAYAKAKGIKLAVLRTFEEADKAGRLQKIVLNVHVQGAISLSIDKLAMDQANHDRFVAEMAAAGLKSGIHSDSPV